MVSKSMPNSINLDPAGQRDLWRHMAKQCVVRLCSYEEYKAIDTTLPDLDKQISMGAYSPQPIIGFLSEPKANGVPRFVPVLSPVDLAVYFGCVKAFDERLAGLAVDETFGGWSLGGARRSQEEEIATAIIVDAEVPDEPDGVSVPMSAYNRLAWVENWSQFWKLVGAKYEYYPATACFAMFDIANFYDSIDLPRLEREIRGCCGEENIAIEVLFFLLSTWNKRLNKYARSTKGLPMDIVGDCSRVLANFYLVPFDRIMRQRALEKNGSFLRFADDMVLACSDRGTCEELVFTAAGLLHEIGLNINVSKVKYFEKASFERHWGFGILDKFEDDGTLAEGLEALKARWDQGDFGRRETALKRAVTILARHPEMHPWRGWAFSVTAASQGLLLSLNERQMSSLLQIAPDLGEAVGLLIQVVLNAPYTVPKARLLRCLERYRSHTDQDVRTQVLAMTASIQQLADPVLDLALRNTPPVDMQA